MLEGYQSGYQNQSFQRVEELTSKIQPYCRQEGLDALFLLSIIKQEKKSIKTKYIQQLIINVFKKLKLHMARIDIIKLIQNLL